VPPEALRLFWHVRLSSGAFFALIMGFLAQDTWPGFAFVVADVLWVLAFAVVRFVDLVALVTNSIYGSGSLAGRWTRICAYGKALAHLGAALVAATSIGAAAGALRNASGTPPAAIASPVTPAAWAAGWSAKSFDSTLGYPGEGPPSGPEGAGAPSQQGGMEGDTLMRDAPAAGGPLAPHDGALAMEVDADPGVRLNRRRRRAAVGGGHPEEHTPPSDVLWLWHPVRDERNEGGHMGESEPGQEEMRGVLFRP
ncbi:unnamed protein product, partial [Prorocentrum cordatum]